MFGYGSMNSCLTRRWSFCRWILSSRFLLSELGSSVHPAPLECIRAARFVPAMSESWFNTVQTAAVLTGHFVPHSMPTTPRVCLVPPAYISALNYLRLININNSYHQGCLERSFFGTKLFEQRYVFKMVRNKLPSSALSRNEGLISHASTLIPYFIRLHGSTEAAVGPKWTTKDF